jgi:hypothetical protein
MRRSMWICLSALAALLASATVSNARASGYGGHSDYAESVRCESKKNRQQYCHIDTRYGVVLLEQRSRTRCIEGHTWGFDRRGVWVSGGCRGVFAAASAPRQHYRDDRRYDRYEHDRHRGGAGYGHSAPVFRCESRGYGQTYCAVPFRGQVDIVRQLSRSRCDFGRDWGHDRRGVWVANGCRAEFTVY